MTITLLDARVCRKIAFYWIAILVGVLIAVIAPSDVLRSNASVDFFVTRLSRAIPTIDQFAMVSRFPDITRLVMTLLWCIVPVQVSLFFYKKTFQPNLKPIQQGPLLFAFFMVTAIGCYVGFWFFLELTPDRIQGDTFHRVVFRQMSESRFWLGFWTGIITTGLALLVSVFCVWVRHASNSLLLRKERKNNGHFDH